MLKLVNNTILLAKCPSGSVGSTVDRKQGPRDLVLWGSVPTPAVFFFEKIYFQFKTIRAKLKTATDNYPCVFGTADIGNKTDLR